MPAPLEYTNSPLGKGAKTILDEVTRVETQFHLQKNSQKQLTPAEHQAQTLIHAISDILSFTNRAGPTFNNKNIPLLSLAPLLLDVDKLLKLRKIFSTPEVLLSKQLNKAIPDIVKKVVGNNSSPLSNENFEAIKGEMQKWLIEKDSTYDKKIAAELILILIDSNLELPDDGLLPNQFGEYFNDYRLDTINPALRNVNKLVKFDITHQASYELSLVLLETLSHLPESITELAPFLNQEKLKKVPIKRIKIGAETLFGDNSNVYSFNLNLFKNVVTHAIADYFRHPDYGNTPHAQHQKEIYQKLIAYHENLFATDYPTPESDDQNNQLNHEKKKLLAIKDQLERNACKLHMLLPEITSTELVPSSMIMATDKKQGVVVKNFKDGLIKTLSDQIAKIERSMKDYEDRAEQSRQQQFAQMTLRQSFDVETFQNIEDQKKKLASYKDGLNEALERNNQSTQKLTPLSRSHETDQQFLTSQREKLVKELHSTEEKLGLIEKQEKEYLTNLQAIISAKLTDLGHRRGAINPSDTASIESFTASIAAEIEKMKSQLLLIRDHTPNTLDYRETQLENTRITNSIAQFENNIKDLIQTNNDRKQRQDLIVPYTKLLNQHFEARIYTLGFENKQVRALSNALRDLKPALDQYIINGDKDKFLAALGPEHIYKKIKSLQPILEDLKNSVTSAKKIQQSGADYSEAMPQYNQLTLSIKTMRDYGESLSNQKSLEAKHCGEVTMRLADKLQSKADTFYQNYNPRKVIEFEENFKKLLHSQDDVMSHQRAKWKVIVANVALALTVVGAVALAVRYKRQSSLFFSDTKRQQHLKKIEQSLPDQKNPKKN